MAKSYARIDVLTAPEANIGVVIRRGPTKLVQMLVWNFSTDEVTPGEWIKGRVYSQRSDVSPDGKVVALFVMGTVPESEMVRIPDNIENTCIVFCRPPSFLPIGLFFTCGTWGGAGIWKDNDTFHAHPDPYTFREAIKPPSKISVIRKAYLRDPDVNIHKLKLLAREWHPELNSLNITRPIKSAITVLDLFKSMIEKSPFPMTDDRIILATTTYKKSFNGGTIYHNLRYESESAWVCDTDGNELLKLKAKHYQPIWIDTDNSGRLLYADQGCLWAWPDFPSGKPELIANLNDNKVEHTSL